MPAEIVCMEMSVWWEAPISMRVEWRCASMTSGGQCVMTPGTTLMLLWSASNWDIHTLEVSMPAKCTYLCCFYFYVSMSCAGGRAYSSAHFGAGSGPIFLDDVQCTPSSSQLLECHSSPILSHNCLHSADAGVGCEGIIMIPVVYWRYTLQRSLAELKWCCTKCNF